MDFKEKYQEVLERAKKGLPITEVFPELKGSEDEKLRKEIISCIKSHVLPRGLLIRGGEFYREDAVSYLEKQKENPKSADSIPSDCVSDAKCEDRWHKVTDSLPDNGRLVLAKDCLGNVLLARFDGENWEVNVYDNEDHYCHNSISNWCEIPSEKQKEQKPAEWSEEEKGILLECVSALQNSSHWLLTDKLSSLRPQPKQEWSEEDEKQLNWFYRLLDFIDKEFPLTWGQNHKGGKEWLKSLKDSWNFSKSNTNSPSWKPSKEQMEALRHYVDTTTDGEIDLLYNDLKKLI